MYLKIQPGLLSEDPRLDMQQQMVHAVRMQLMVMLLIAMQINDLLAVEQLSETLTPEDPKTANDKLNDEIIETLFHDGKIQLSKDGLAYVCHSPGVLLTQVRCGVADQAPVKLNESFVGNPRAISQHSRFIEGASRMFRNVAAVPTSTAA